MSRNDSDMTDPADDNIFIWARDIQIEKDEPIFESAYKGGETEFSEMTMNLATYNIIRGSALDGTYYSIVHWNSLCVLTN